MSLAALAISEGEHSNATAASTISKTNNITDSKQRKVPIPQSQTSLNIGQDASARTASRGRGSSQPQHQHQTVNESQTGKDGRVLKSVHIDDHCDNNHRDGQIASAARNGDSKSSANITSIVSPNYDDDDADENVDNFTAHNSTFNVHFTSSTSGFISSDTARASIATGDSLQAIRAAKKVRLDTTHDDVRRRV